MEDKEGKEEKTIMETAAAWVYASYPSKYE